MPSFPFPTSDIFPAAVFAGRMERHFPDAGAWNEFNSTALRNWLRSHSSDKFLIVCPAPSGEFARFRHPRGWSPLSYSGLTTSIYVQDTTGVSRVFRVVSRNPRPAGPLMVMVITGSNCEQWNYEISKFAATVLASTHASSFCGDSLF